MNLLRLVDRLAADNHHSVTFEAQRCLHDLDRFQECDNCVNVCPAGAISGEKIPDFDIESCAHCLACLPACPAGAFTGEDEVPALLRCVSSLSSGRMELLCRHNARAEKGLPGVEAAICVRGCLAGLGLGAYLLLAAMGLEQVVVRNDACHDCPWPTLTGRVADQVAQAQRLLHLWHRDQTVILSGPSDPSWRERPVYPAGSPPVSRRDLFRLRLPAPKMEADQPIPDGNQPFRERLRLIQAFQQLGPPDLDAENGPVSGRLPELGLAMVSLVSPTCNACGACARACPTGALNLDMDNQAYTLTFDGRACIGCDVCAHVCPMNIVEVEHAPSFQEVFGEPDPVTLQSGPVSRCRRCHACFPAAEGEDYCAVCRFRLRHPFGSARPGSFLAENQVRQEITS